MDDAALLLELVLWLPRSRSLFFAGAIFPVLFTLENCKKMKKYDNNEIGIENQN